MEIWAWKQLEQFMEQVRKEIADMALQLAQLIEKVAALTTVTDSVLALIDGLRQMVEDLKVAVGDNAAAQAAIDKAAQDLETERARLAAAVTANTGVPPSA